MEETNLQRVSVKATVRPPPEGGGRGVDTQRRLWSDDAPYELWAGSLLVALSGRAGSDDYVHDVARSAWAGTLELLGDRRPRPARLTFAEAGHLESAAVTTLSDGTVELSIDFLRRAAFECLCAAEERTIGFSQEAGFGNPPSWICPPEEFIARVIDLDVLERSHVFVDGFVDDYADAAILAARSHARGEPVPVIASQLRGLASLGMVPGRIRRGDQSRLVDPDWSAHIIRLHHYTLLNMLMFVLAHECAHLTLGHFSVGQQDGSRASHRDMEVQADLAALHAVQEPGGADLATAVSALGEVHTSERAATRRSSLSHPYSTERLRLLAHAVQQAGAPALVVARVNQVMRHLHLSLGAVDFYDAAGTRQSVELDTSYDLNQCFVHVKVTAPGALDRGQLPVEGLVGLSVRYRDLVSGEQLAESFVAALFTEELVTTAVETSDGAETVFLSTLRLIPPPAWRDRWPTGVLEVVSVCGKEDAAHRLDTTPAALLTGLLLADRQTQWSLPDDAIMGATSDVVDAGASTSWSTVLQRRDWCLMLGLHDAALDLSALVLREAPTLMGHQAAVETLQGLNHVGRCDEVVRLGSAYSRRMGVIRPGISFEIGRAAESLGDVLLAYDQYCIEAQGFSPRELGAAAQQAMVELMSATRDTPVTATLLQFHAESLAGTKPALTPWGRRRCADRLRHAFALLDRQLPERASQLLFITQLKIETLVALWHIAKDRPTGELAAEGYDRLLADHPGWAPGWVQAAYLADDLGERERAVQLFRRGERIAPGHPQVEQGHDRFFPTDPAYHRAQLEFLERAGAVHGF